MSATRVVNILLGVLMIPVLIRYLGGEGFAAWALFLSVGMAFSILDIGMPSSIIKYMAVSLDEKDNAQANQVLTNALVFLFAVYMASLPVVLWLAKPIVSWLRLPNGAHYSAQALFVFVFVSIALRSLLMCGTYTFYSARMFHTIAIISFCQSFLSNCGAIIAAYWWRRLDLSLGVFWGMQLAVVGFVFLRARRVFRWKFRITSVNLTLLRQLTTHGLKVHVSNWTQLVNFQFDKLIIAGFVGLWAVAPYEVANRSVLALRSVLVSGIEAFLPSATINAEEKSRAWGLYQKMTKLTVYGVVLFLIAPLTIAPMFLYAWTGEMGIYARWIFVALILGVVANITVLPSAIIVQAAGHAEIQTKSAIFSVILNIPLSLLFIQIWGSVGAAIGTGIALVGSACLLFYSTHRYYGKDMARTLHEFWYKLWPALIVCLVWALFSFALFKVWFATFDPHVRYSIHTRIYPGIVSLLLYAGCIKTIIIVLAYKGLFDREELELLFRVIRFRWFRNFCQARAQLQGKPV